MTQDLDDIVEVEIEELEYDWRDNIIEDLSNYKRRLNEWLQLRNYQHQGHEVHAYHNLKTGEYFYSVTPKE